MAELRQKCGSFYLLLSMQQQLSLLRRLLRNGARGLSEMESGSEGDLVSRVGALDRETVQVLATQGDTV